MQMIPVLEQTRARGANRHRTWLEQLGVVAKLTQALFVGA